MYAFVFLTKRSGKAKSLWMIHGVALIFFDKYTAKEG